MKRSLTITNSLLRMRRSPACVLQRTVEEPSTRQGLFSQFQSISGKQVSNMNLFFKNKLLFALLEIRIFKYSQGHYIFLTVTDIFHWSKWQFNMKMSSPETQILYSSMYRFGKWSLVKSRLHHVYIWEVWVGFKLNMLSWVLLWNINEN